jgi:hypothetical protein
VALAWIEWRGIVWLTDRRYFEVFPIVMSIYLGPDIRVVVPPGEGPPELIEWFPRRCEFISPPRLSLSNGSVLEVDLLHLDGLRQREQILRKYANDASLLVCRYISCNLIVDNDFLDA